LLKVGKKRGLFDFLEKKAKTSQFFFCKNNIIEREFLDFPYFCELPGNIPVSSRIIQFPDSFLSVFPGFSRFSRLIDTLLFDRNDG